MIFNQTAQAIGLMGEFHAQNSFAAAGYDVEKPSEKHVGDLRVTDTKTGEIFKIEVKTARKDVRGKWHFCLEKRGKTSVQNSDFVLFQCISKAGDAIQYLIPAVLLDGKKTLTICKPYAGKYDVFRVRKTIILGGRDD